MRIISLILIIFLTSCGSYQQRSISFETVKKDTTNNYYSMKLTYPLFHSPNQLVQLNDSINKLLFSHTSEYRGEKYDDLKQLLTEINQGNTDFNRRYETIIDYEPFLINAEIVSLRFHIYEYTLGAHGNTSYVSLNYIPENNSFYSPKEILSIATTENQELLISLLKKHIVDPDNCFNFDNNVLNEIKNINFSSNKTIFTFAPYAVGPYSCGTAQIEIPTHTLLQKGVLDPSFGKHLYRN